MTTSRLVSILQSRLVGLIDLALVLKHVHWNVVGPNFLSVHEMLDNQVGPVREMSDQVAERIATLGGTPDGTSGAVVAQRTWEDYPHGREASLRHLQELDAVYGGVIASHRKAIAEVADLDPVTQDLLISQTAQLELFQWFVRSFVERTVPGDRTSADRTSADRADGIDTHPGPTPGEAALADVTARDVDPSPAPAGSNTG